ncbi:type II toxin-antitoxin system RatA family toxin [Marinobacteraceae bacterium S3BR75-40.1]
MAHRIDRSALVWHPAERMFDLVNDIPSYPLFLPWCSAAEVHPSEEADVLASIEVAKGGMRHRFTTRNRLDKPSRIEMALVDGPFSALSGQWQFQALNEKASKIILTLDFEFSGRLTSMAFGNVFGQAANTMVDAFCRRASELYGEVKA